MEQYCSELKVFRQSVTLRVFWKLGSFKIHDVTSCGWKRAVTKHGITADSTLEDVARVQHKVAYEFQLQEFAFILEDVLEHSVHVSWLLPCSVVGVLLCGLTPALLDELLIEDITLIDEEEESQHDQEGTGCNSCRAVERHQSSSYPVYTDWLLYTYGYKPVIDTLSHVQTLIKIFVHYFL